MSASRTSSTTTIRRVRERTGALAWWPWGVIPAVLLGAVVLYALFRLPRTVIEPGVREAVQNELLQAGVDWAEVKVRGRQVVLSGTPPTAEAAEQARTMALAATAPTWSGQRVAPASVHVDFAEPSPSEGLPPPRASWQFQKRADTLRLTGLVADDPARAAVAGSARALAERVGIAQVTDDLEIGASGAHSSAVPAKFGLSLLERCLTGRVSLDHGELEVFCEVERPEGAEAIRSALASAPDDLAVGEVELLVREQADACDAAMSKLLKQPVRFQLSDAVVQRRSYALLDSIAEASKSCPGTLRIEGHTDSTGTRAYNQQLSADRADAVKAALVERGVAADRLVTVGLGPDQPIADNSTAPGRAANRRIEINVVRPNDP